ncbi:chemotaxis protein CheB [Methylobacterium sp. NEAU 140]|uniref:chemotaxis protein CheB n=1 Tax=Methylobacterium sp. NEAU 140 TaxID=3064945 RepID=UPI0027337564|nr:chemotaxis protein CheB [Methylobacterium sp. NEAU 140]MDP4026687.1 chemotaxis protein CheB [Methylobacterium sp. NEAU 140]
MTGPIIVIAASAGGLEPLKRIVAAMPADCAASLFVVVHIGDHTSRLPDVLAGITPLPVAFALDDEPIEPGRIYVAPSGRHMRLENARIRLDRGPKVHSTRPAADPLFVSAAETFGARVVGIVLSGRDSDGAEGLRVIKLRGGQSLVQHPAEALVPEMPWSAFLRDSPDASLSVDEIAGHVAALCSGKLDRDAVRS